MAGSQFENGRPLVVGANHRSSSLSLRDRLFVEDADLPGVFQALREIGLNQAIFLSTCDRVEVVAVVGDVEGAIGELKAFFANRGQLAPEDMDQQLYAFTDQDAVRHVFSVAASLDSLIIGEPQVLGQVKAGHRAARDAGLVDGGLETLLQAAYGAAKRVRTESEIGQRPVSIAAAAVQAARDLHGDLGRCAGLIVGAGDMGEMVADAFLSAGLENLTASHPTESRAEAIARNLDCHVALFEKLSEELVEADIVIAAMGRRRHVLTVDMVAAGLRKRRHRPVLIVDTGIPGDVEPAVERIDEAFLYDLNDLEQVALDGRASRETEAAKAVEIIDAEVENFFRGQAGRAAVPALIQLRRHAEDIRMGALREARGDAEKATRLVVNRLLHTPSEFLRQMAERNGAAGGAGNQTAAEWTAAERTLRRFFGLDSEEEGGAEAATDQEENEK